MDKIMIYVRAAFNFTFVLIAGVSIGLCANGFIVRFQEPQACPTVLSPLPSPSAEDKAGVKPPKKSARMRALAEEKGVSL